MNLLNQAGALLGKLGIDPFALSASKILTRARETAGFDFTDHQMQVGLDRLIGDIQAHAKPNTFGKIAMKNLLQRNATARFQVEHTIHSQPHIAAQPIKQPLFIVGMPRSGTTILHALLHCDADNRSPLSWECLLPHPVPNPTTYTDNPQLNQVRKEFEQLFQLVPDFKKKHYMEADSPQECLGITALHFTSFQFLAQLYLPDYYRWLTFESDLNHTMVWHKRFLQYLQSGGVTGERWLLKSPVHLLQLNALFDVYPDARIVVTHRHPNKVIPSAASLVSSVRSLYSDAEDPHRTGKEQLAAWAHYCDRFLEERLRVDKESQIIDLHFDEFATDQMAMVERIYTQFGMHLSAQSRERMQAFLAAQPKDKHGEHDYSLQQFGLTGGDIEKHYPRYLAFIASLTSSK